jgi:xanthine dehydrogenase accessory factor
MSSVYETLAEMERNRKPGVLCTVILSKGSTPRGTGSKMIVFLDGTIVGTVGGGEIEGRVIKTALEALRDGKPKKMSYDLVDPDKGDPGICGGSVEVFVEPIFPRPQLVIVGGGHVGQAVAHLGKWLGFHVVITDDREEYSRPDVIPDADDWISCPMEELPERIDFSPGSVIILATRSMTIDVQGIPELIKVPSAYIGLISSRRRWKLTADELRQAGVADEDIQRIHAPIGLDIGAETPEEIALSILGEVIMVLREGSGGSLSR